MHLVTNLNRLITILFSFLIILSCNDTKEVDSRAPSQVLSPKVSTLMKEGFAKTFFAISTPEDLDTFLKILEKNYKNIGNNNLGETNIFASLQKKLNLEVWNGSRNQENKELDFDRERDVKLAAALMIPLRESRGMLWRLHPLTDDIDFTQTSIIAQIVAMVSAIDMFNSYQVDGRGKNINNAIFDYITQPWFKKNSEEYLPQFQTVSDLQAYVKSAYSDTLENTIKKVKGINISDDSPLYFDAQLAVNSKIFDPDFRWVSLGTVEKWEILSNLYLIQHYQKLYIGTNINALKEFVKDLTKSTILGGNKYFFLGQISRRAHFDPKGIDSSPYSMSYGHRNFDFAKLVVKRKYKDLFTVKNRKSYTDAFEDLKQYVRLKKKIINYTSNGERNISPEIEFLFNPFRILKFDEESRKVARKSIHNIEVMLDDNPQFIVNNITGEEVVVRVKTLYYDIHDFKTLVPGVYKNGRRGSLNLDSKFYSRIDNEVNKKYPLSVRDYRAGRPIKWNTDVLSALFPEIRNLRPGQSQEDRIKLHIRSLAQSFGAIGVIVPMMTQF